MKNDKKKKKNNLHRSPRVDKNNDQHKFAIQSLIDAFGSSVSIDDARSALNDANGDVNVAGDILNKLLVMAANKDDGDGEGEGDYPSMVSGTDWSSSCEASGSSSSWTSSVSGSSEDQDAVAITGLKQKKRVIAATGTVSTMLGKDYVKKVSPRVNGKLKEKFGTGENKEEAEQFLCSMLGDDCELGMAVVRDVLCQCGFNVDKALDVLLDLSTSASEESIDVQNKGGRGQMRGDYLANGTSDCTSQSSEADLHDSIWSIDNGLRSYAKVLTSSEAPRPTITRSNESDMPYEVLESLFNISPSSEHEPSTMDWSKVVKKMQSLGPAMNFNSSSVAESLPETCGKVDDYHLYREPAKRQWEAMKSYYQKAATAYSNGNKAYAAYLSDQAKLKNRYAKGAEERASQDIFKSRNKGIENVITIDLHGQHVKPAMKMLKRHLLLVSFVSSIQTLRVITGCGSHGVGKSVVKQSVVKLLEKEGLKWSEENKGTVLIEMNGCRELSFLDSESDIEE
ncbi:hypothetical protein ACFE04_011885 [Oxalis oulophora]